MAGILKSLHAPSLERLDLSLLDLTETRTETLPVDAIFHQLRHLTLQGIGRGRWVSVALLLSHLKHLETLTIKRSHADELFIALSSSSTLCPYLNTIDISAYGVELKPNLLADFGLRLPVTSVVKVINVDRIELVCLNCDMSWEILSCYSESMHQYSDTYHCTR